MPATHPTVNLSRSAMIALLVVSQSALGAYAQQAANCPEMHDPPLGELTVDITPMTPQGELVEADELPGSCWDAAGLAGPAKFVGCMAGCGCWDHRCLLQIARFRHPYVYFEDECLERYGDKSRLQVLCSPARFLGEVAIMPVKMILHCRECVCTPTPHVCSPDVCACH